MKHRFKLHKVLVQSLSFSFDEQYLAYFVVNSLVFGAITGLLITLKMMASNTGKIDPKNPPRMSDFGGGGGEG